MSRIFRKSIPLLLLAVLILFTIPQNAGAAEAAQSGSCGEDLTWTLDQEGTLTVFGSGQMYAYTNAAGVPWHSFRSDVINVVIEEGVTGISSFAFQNCVKLQQTTVADTVTSIGDSAFALCTSLSSFRVPNGVEKIGYGVFYNCGNLTEIVIPEGVTDIGPRAFAGCRSLRELTIPNSVTSIGWSAFEDCAALQSITIPDGVTKIAMSTFYGCSSLTEVRIPDSVTRIEGSAFSGCGALANITVPNTVTYLGESVFSDCTSLRAISLPEGLSAIENDTFMNCVCLQEISVPEGVTQIGNWAFAGCKELKSVDIADSVTDIGQYAFRFCTALTEISIPKAVTDIDTGMFSGCSALNELEIPVGVTKIGNQAFFDCENLTKVWIPGSVTEISGSAFSYCDSLTVVGHVQTLAEEFAQTNGVPFEPVHFYGDWKTTVEPTYQMNGEKVRSCVYCAETQTEEINNNPFPDVKADSFKDYILWCSYEGIINGDKQGYFNPENTITRGQFILMLWRAAGKPEPTQFKAFPDVTENNKTYYKAVCWAVEMGITNGKVNGDFGLSDPCTRGHVALFLYRYAGQPTPAQYKAFPDVTGGTYYNAVCWLVEQGITNGQKDGTFGVSNPCQRRHVAKFLFLYLNEE